MPADLHIHSNFSDGTNSPEEIVELAKKGNLTNKASKQAVKVFLEGIRDSLKRGEKVVITGFGTFSVRSRKEKVPSGKPRGT